MRPEKFQIFKVSNALMPYECKRLIELHQAIDTQFVMDFHGFDVEYIDNRIVDITHELTNIDEVNQEPFYIAKTKDGNAIETNRADAWNDGDKETLQYGNRIFTALFLLSDGEVFFPNINLQHKMNAGDALIWNNVVVSGRVLDAINRISNNTYYVKKWVREKPFI